MTDDPEMNNPTSEQPSKLSPTEELSSEDETEGRTCSTVSQVIAHLYRETLQETLCQAVRNGYNGLDISHIEIEGLSTRLKWDVWQANKWHEEPPELPGDQGRRYDFRYYDRERLLTDLEHGEVPPLFTRD